MQYPALYINLCKTMHGKKILRADIKLLNLVRFGVSSDTTHVEKTVQYTNHRRIESMRGQDILLARCFMKRRILCWT